MLRLESSNELWFDANDVEMRPNPTTCSKKEKNRIEHPQGWNALLDKKLALPAYDQCLKASHIFNLLDARGVIGVAERANYIDRIRELSKGSGKLWLESQ